MRSSAEIDRDYEGMNEACTHRDHGCTYPACKCDRSQRIVPNVRGVSGPKLTPAQIADCRRDPDWEGGSMAEAPTSAWEDLRTAARVVVMRAEQLRNGRPMPPEITALERALEELAAAGVRVPGNDQPKEP